MTDRTIENRRVVGGDHFRFIYSRSSILKLDYYLDKFNIDEYYIYKMFRAFKKLSKEDLYEFKYSQFLLIKRDYKHSTDKFISFISKTKFGTDIKYLHQPIHIDFPYDKIKIIGSL